VKAAENQLLTEKEEEQQETAQQKRAELRDKYGQTHSVSLYEMFRYFKMEALTVSNDKKNNKKPNNKKKQVKTPKEKIMKWSGLITHIQLREYQVLYLPLPAKVWDLHMFNFVILQNIIHHLIEK